MSIFNLICITAILLVIIMLIYNSCFDLFKSENYTPSIIRPFPLVKSENKCEYPFTNNKKNNIVNDDIYINNYGNRKILNPDEYLKLVEKLLTDLSKNEIDIINIPDNILNEIDYNGDKDYIINFMNNEIKKLVNEKKYLQNNGTWKYEYFNVSNPTIYYYEVINNNIIMNIPEKFNLFKIIYTLGNPLRSSYTSCLAFITLINNKLTLQFTKLVNDNNAKNINNHLDLIPTDALEFEFLDTIANEKFNKYGNPTSNSGLNFISEYKDEINLDIKADIPDEFKKGQKAYLPPLFGNGICKYPPIYKTPDGQNKYFSSPPIH